MRVSTYERHQQAERDSAEHHKAVILAKLMTAGIHYQNGGYPVNPDQETAYSAGFSRGCHWAFDHAIGRQEIGTRWDMADGTYAGQGEQDGWNAVVDALK